MLRETDTTCMPYQFITGHASKSYSKKRELNGAITSRKKVMTKVKVFQKEVKLQGQGHEVNNHNTL